MAPREKTYFANPCDDERVWPVAEASGTSVSRAAFSAIAISMSAIPEPKPALPSEYHDWSEASRIATSSLVTGLSALPRPALSQSARVRSVQARCDRAIIAQRDNWRSNDPAQNMYGDASRCVERPRLAQRTRSPSLFPPPDSGKIEGSPATFPRAIAGTLPIERRPIGDGWRQSRRICVAFQCALALMEGATRCGAAPGAACGAPTL